MVSHVKNRATHSGIREIQGSLTLKGLMKLFDFPVRAGAGHHLCALKSTMEKRDLYKVWCATRGWCDDDNRASPSVKMFNWAFSDLYIYINILLPFFLTCEQLLHYFCKSSDTHHVLLLVLMASGDAEVVITTYSILLLDQAKFISSGHMWIWDPNDNDQSMLTSYVTRCYKLVWATDVSQTWSCVCDVFMSGLQLACMVLDESQYIKNSQSLTAQETGRVDGQFMFWNLQYFLIADVRERFCPRHLSNCLIHYDTVWLSYYSCS